MLGDLVLADEFLVLLVKHNCPKNSYMMAGSVRTPRTAKLGMATGAYCGKKRQRYLEL